MYDFDKSQYISRDELTILMTNSLCALRSLEQQKPPEQAEIELKTNQFFQQADADQNQRITLIEFTNYIKQDPEIVKCLLNYGIAKFEDLGIDFGNGNEEFYDADLQDEIERPESYQDLKRVNAKYNIDFSAAEDSDEDQQAIIIKKKLQNEVLQMVKKDYINSKNEQELQGYDLQKILNQTCPTEYVEGSSKEKEKPDAELELDYIYGYRCSDARNNLRYTEAGELIFHAAGVGVVMNQQNNTQKFMVDHDDDILCLAINRSGQLCATGQVGPTPMICVWDTSSMKVLAKLKGRLSMGVKNLCFSNYGDLLAASGMDTYHNIVIYNWRTGDVHASCSSGKADIWSLSFTSDDESLVATCTKSVKFYTHDKSGTLKPTDVTGWNHQHAPGAITCQAQVNEMCYVGSHDGYIYQIDSSRKAILNLPGSCSHSGVIYTMAPRKLKEGIITGGKDGKVLVWRLRDGQLQLEKSFSLKDLMKNHSAIKSVWEHPKTGNILVGTRSGEIIELGVFDDEKPNIFLKSHHNQEIWGLEVNPIKKEFVTVGQDGMLGVWDIEKHRQTQYAKLESGANCASYTHDGEYLAIGMQNGYILVVNKRFEPFSKAQFSKTGQAITCMSFNDNGTICAVGGADGFVKIYDVKSKFKKCSIVKKSTSAITHIDFSEERPSQEIRYALMVNNAEGQLHYFDATPDQDNNHTQGRIIRDLTQLRDYKWYTHTCNIGWNVQGIIPSNCSHSDINACAMSPDKEVIATADDFGKVNLYRYPCPKPESLYSSFLGHSAHVTNIKFTPFFKGDRNKKAQQSYLLSTGGADLCVFQWKYTYDQDATTELEAIDKKNNMIAREKEIAKHMKVDHVDEADKNQAIEELDVYQDPDTSKDINGISQELRAQNFKEDLRGAVKTMMNVKFKPASNHKSAPYSYLTLKHVHGYRSHDVRGTAKYCSNGIAFTTANLGVVQDISNFSQEFFDLHKDDIVSMAVHPDKNIIATGAMCKKGAKSNFVDIYIWRADSHDVLAHLSGFSRNAVVSMAFSPSGNKLLTVGQDEYHSVAIYDWQNQVLLASNKVGPDRVLDCCWKDEQEFMTVDAEFVRFHKQNGQSISTKKGILGKFREKTRAHICGTWGFDGTMCVTGNESGHLITWEDGKAISINESLNSQHSKGCQQIIYAESEQKFISGGGDGLIKMWDSQMQLLDNINLSNLTDKTKTRTDVRSLDFDENMKTLLVGTRGSQVLELTLSGELLGPQVEGHFSGNSGSNFKLSGIACHPIDQYFATFGSDKRVRIWDMDEHKLTSAEFNNELTTIDWSSNGKFLVLGDNQGFVHIMNAKNLEVKDNTSKLWKVGVKEVLDLKIDPKSNFVAYTNQGASAGKISILKVGNSMDLAPHATINLGKECAIVNFDWSSDSRYLQINTETCELLFANVLDQKAISASEVRDVEWHTQTCKLGFPVQGIWPGDVPSGVNSVARSHNMQVLATTEDSGLVKLFRYPCIDSQAQCKEFHGHSWNVTGAMFTAKDKFLLTIGGHDRTLLVWETHFDDKAKLIDEEEEHVDLDWEEVAEIAYRLGDETRAARKREKEKRQEAERERQAALAKDGELPDYDPVELFYKLEEEDDGDQFLAVKPWKRQIKAPPGQIKPPKNQNKAPGVSAHIEWVHGYRGYKCRNNARFLADGSIAYHAAGLGIVSEALGKDQPSSEATQRHFDKHIDDVTAMAFSSDRRIVATGEVGKKPKIYIWDALSMQVKHTLSGELTHGIKCMSFSPSGKYLVAVDDSNDHRIVVYNARNGIVIAKSAGDKAPIADVACQDDSHFATAGVRHLKFWTLNKGRLTSKNGSWGGCKDKNLACVEYNGTQCLTGTSSGAMLAWRNREIEHENKKLHGGVIDCIRVVHVDQRTKDGGVEKVGRVLTGGRDMKINIFDATNLEKMPSSEGSLPLSTVDLSKKDEKGLYWGGSVCARPRALDMDVTGERLLIGTYGCELFTVALSKASTSAFASKIGAGSGGFPIAITRGHYAPKAKAAKADPVSNEVWGLCTCPSVGEEGQMHYVTVSDDATLRLWDSNSHQQLSCVRLDVHSDGRPLKLDPHTKELSLDAQARAVDVHPSGGHYAVGFRSGSVRIIDSRTVDSKFIKQLNDCGKEWIEDLKYSPDGRYLAVSSHDNGVYIYETENYSKFSVIRASTSFVNHLDWSADSKWIRTNDGSAELLYFKVKNGTSKPAVFASKKAKRSDVDQLPADLEWATHTCVFEWASQGIWQQGMDGSDINHCDRSSTFTHKDGYQLLATGDDFGRVRLYRYPSMVEHSKSLTLRGHCSHVTKVKFAGEGSNLRLYSAGGNDTTVIQWKIEV